MKVDLLERGDDKVNKGSEGFGSTDLRKWLVNEKWGGVSLQTESDERTNFNKSGLPIFLTGGVHGHYKSSQLVGGIHEDFERIGPETLHRDSTNRSITGLNQTPNEN